MEQQGGKVTGGDSDKLCLSAFGKMRTDLGQSVWLCVWEIVFHEL